MIPHIPVCKTLWTSSTIRVNTEICCLLVSSSKNHSRNKAEQTFFWSLTFSRLSLGAHTESSSTLLGCPVSVGEERENQPHTSPDPGLLLKRSEAATAESSFCFHDAGHKSDLSWKFFKSFSVKRQDIHVGPENWPDTMSLQIWEDLSSSKSCFKMMLSMGAKMETKPQEQNNSI